MKILLANKFFYLKGGSEYVFFDSAKLLESRGHKVIFFSMRHPRNFSSEYEKYFVSNVDYESNRFKSKIDASLKLLYSFEAKRKIEELIKKERPDVAHLHNIYHQISPSILHSLKKFKIPIIMTLHDYKLVCPNRSLRMNESCCEECNKGKYFRCIINLCVSKSYIKSSLNMIEMYFHHSILHIYELIDIFIAPSIFLKNKIEEMGFKGEIVYLPNFIHNKELDYFCNWQDQERIILYFGRLSKIKGLLTLLEAVRGLNVELRIVGEGPLRSTLEYKVRKDQLKNVCFLGYKQGEALYNEIQKAMAVILPSEWYENSPRSIIEAFSLGKPVIGSRIGGIPEFIKDKETGLTFKPGNAEDLRTKIQFFLNNQDITKKWGENARKLIEEKFSEDKYYEEIMKLYKEAIRKAKQ
ncbi:MAG: glycosyltransferase family 4 protein [Candidatus Omnitrophota bacterium]|nr:glycosyltransferase family 4 protein [Candidatus Omnitrophota bacterium]